MNSWFPLSWGGGCPAAAPKAVLSLAALGDMAVKPQPSGRVRAEIAKVFPGRRFVWLCQEHTKIVLQAEVPAGEEPGGRTGDGLVTKDPQTLIGVTVADCLPVFLWDAETGARAVVHSGWKGTGIVREAIRGMKTLYGSLPKRAMIGPGIGSCCYAVPRERAEAFAAEFGSDTAFLRGGNWYMDLAAANRSILAAEGVNAVHVHPECTCCDTRFSSYRRQGKAFTRMIALL